MDPQIQHRLMIYGGFVPGAISLILMLAAWYIHALRQSRADHIEGEDSSPTGDGPRWLLPIMLALGFAGGDYAFSYTFHLWPTNNSDRFTHAIVLIALIGVLEGVIRWPMLVAFLFRVVAFGGAFWMLGEGYSETIFGGTPTFVGSTIFAGLAGATIATGADRNSEDTPAWVDAITWLVIAGAAMPIFLLNHFSIGAMIPSGIIAVLVSTLIVGLIFKDLRLSRGGVTVLVGVLLTMLTGSIIQTGADYLPSLLLLALSPMVTLIPLKTPSGFGRLLARLILLALILGLSGGLMYWSNAASSGGDEVDPYADYEPGA